MYYDYKGPIAPIESLRVLDGEPLTAEDADAPPNSHLLSSSLHLSL